MESEFNLGVGTQSETHLRRTSLENVYFRKATRLHAGGPFKKSSSDPLSIHSPHSSKNSFATPPEITNNPLLKKRQMLLNKIQRIVKSLREVTTDNVNEFDWSIERLKKCQEEFDLIQDEIVMNSDHLEEEAIWQGKLDDLIEEGQKLYLPAKHAAASIVSSSRNSPKPSINLRSHLKLPKIELPKFDGKSLSDWSVFRGLFEVTIHNATELTKQEKLQYLLAQLSGDALNHVKNLEFTSENYDVAWKLLNEYYNSPRRQITHHLVNFLDLPELGANNVSVFFTKLRENMQALEALGYKSENYGLLLIVILLRKMNNYHRRRFEDSRDDKSAMPTVEELCTYLKDELSQYLGASSTFRQSQPQPCRAPKKEQPQMILHNSSKENKKGSSDSKKYQNKVQNANPLEVPECFKCPQCPNANHVISQCQNYRMLSPQERKKVLEKYKLCLNCTSKDHFVSSCKSKRKCRECNGSHHSSIHENRGKTFYTQLFKHEQSNDEPERSLINHVKTTSSILPTVKVLLTNEKGDKIIVRGCIDTGADRGVLTSQCCQLLNLKPKRGGVTVSGLSGNVVESFGSVQINILNRNGKLVAPNYPVIVVRKITDPVPSVLLDPKLKEVLKNRQLADDSCEKDAKIDILLGVDIYANIVTGIPEPLGPSLPSILPTVFGDVVLGRNGGEFSALHSKPLLLNSTVFMVNVENKNENNNLNKIMEKFWTIEEINPPKKAMTPEEEYAEKYYVETTTQLENKKYQVRLPFSENAKN